MKCLFNLFKQKPVVEEKKEIVPPLSREDLRIFAKTNYHADLRTDIPLEKMFELLSREEIEDIGRKIYKIELDRRFTKANMVLELKRKYGKPI